MEHLITLHGIIRAKPFEKHLFLDLDEGRLQRAIFLSISTEILDAIRIDVHLRSFFLDKFRLANLLQ